MLSKTTPVIIILIIITFSSILFLFFENHIKNCHTFVDHLYFGTITVTTIGYGDMYPTTQVSKIMSVFYILTIYIFIFYSICHN